MSSTSRRSFYSLLLFLGTIGVGIVLGISVGNGITRLKYEGFWSSWKLLPNDLKFDEIVDATSRAILAQAEDGKLYYYPFICYEEYPDCLQYRWIEARAIPEELHNGFDMPLELGKTCPEQQYIKYLRNPPGDLVSCARTWSMGLDIVPGAKVYYALTGDGKIWSWTLRGSMLDAPFFILTSSCSGLALGIAGFVILSRIRKEKDKRRIDYPSLSGPHQL